MRYLFLLFAIICGVCLLLKVNTGTLDPGQVAGAGIILLGLAIVSPAEWPANWRA